MIGWTIALVVSTCHAQPVTSENDAFTVTLASTQLVDDADGLFAHTIDITNKRLGRRDQVRWTDHASTFTSVRVFQDRAVLVGRVEGSADAVSIVDLTNRKAVGFILCRTPALSADGRMLAFQQFVARQALRGGPSDLVLVVDVTRAVTAGDASPTDWVYAGRAHGTIVYPPAMAGQQYTKPQTVEYHANTSVLTGFRWLDRPRRLVFASRWMGQMWIAAVEVPDDLARSVVRQRQIDARAFMEDGAPADRVRAAEAELRIAGLELLDQSKVAVDIEPNPLFARTRVVLPMPEAAEKQP